MEFVSDSDEQERPGGGLSGKWDSTCRTGHRGGIVKQQPKTGRQPARRQPKTTDRTAVAFDTWIEDKLRNAYSSVLDEPIPDDLIKLLADKLKD